jgi:hypothetical protein
MTVHLFLWSLETSNYFEMKQVRFPSYYPQSHWYTRALTILVYFAALYAQRGGNVFVQNYKSMPHVFLLFDSHPSTRTCYEQIAKFVLDVIGHGGKTITTRMEIINGRGIIESEKTVDQMTYYPFEMEEKEVGPLLWKF